MIFIFFSFIWLALSRPIKGSTDDLAPYVSDMSEDLYYMLFRDNANHSVYGSFKDSEFLNRGHLESYRRFAVWAVNRFWTFGYHDSYWSPIEHVCVSMKSVYRGSLDYIYRYYNIRALYSFNKEYEIGYLCHQIIYRYQVMIETYHIVIQKFVKHPDERKLHIPPFFYFYTNMLEQGQIIAQYVNMLNQVEKKYKGVTNKVWRDPPTTTANYHQTGKKGGHHAHATYNYSDSIASNQNRVKQKIKDLKQKRKQERERKRQVILGVITEGTFTKPTRPPWTKKKNEHWLLDYGWSIEEW